LPDFLPKIAGIVFPIPAIFIKVLYKLIAIAASKFIDSPGLGLFSYRDGMRGS
jgi:hypothetical protein